jgi:hypothetical protein
VAGEASLAGSVSEALHDTPELAFKLAERRQPTELLQTHLLAEKRIIVRGRTTHSSEELV